VQAPADGGYRYTGKSGNIFYRWAAHGRLSPFLSQGTCETLDHYIRYVKLYIANEKLYIRQKAATFALDQRISTAMMLVRNQERPSPARAQYRDMTDE